MIFDANASLGHWPFRAHRTRTAAQLLERLDEVGIDRALVGSLSAICYRDCQRGNEELLADLAPHRDRLVPLAVLNPTYAGWQRDLDACVTAGCVGVRLYPNYHRYDLGDADAQRLIGAAAERGLLLCFVCRHEDRRQRHWLDMPDDIAPAAVAQALRPFPTARFLILEGLGLEHTEFATEPLWRERHFGLDISRMATVLTRSIPKLIEQLGAEKLVFGTGLPLKGPNSALIKLNLLDDSHQRQAIGGDNLSALVEAGR